MKISLKSFKKTFKKKKPSILLILFLILISFSLGMYTQKLIEKNREEKILEVLSEGVNLSTLSEEVLPKDGFILKINFSDLGKRMVEDGVIDEVKLAKAITGGEELPADFKKYLDGSNQSKIEVNAKTAQFWVDFLWGLGLANKNEILETGVMVEGGNTANFASTGGYTIGKKAPMEIYSQFSYIKLSETQRAKVKEIADNVFRPCCGNPTSFPDCNHGMAALGLIELLVSQGKSEDEIYKTVLKFNSYWFPQTYLDIAYHFAKNGKDYKNVSAKELLSKTFSSAMGYMVIKKQIGEINWPVLQQGGGSCGA